MRGCMKYVLALDQGTTSTRAVLFDRSGKIVQSYGREIPQIYPAPGMVEHDPEEIFFSSLRAISNALERAGIAADDIAAMGITNQRETTIVWDKTTGRAVCNAIVWQCRRTERRCAQLREEGLTGLIRRKTGLIPDPYFSATKLEWILNNVPGARRGAERGELLFGTVDTYLIWKLTGGRVFATDYTNAARTMLFNIHTLEWDDELLRCARGCPQKNITMANGKPVFGGHCVGCVKCSFGCPEGAIKIGVLNGWRVNGSYDFSGVPATDDEVCRYCRRSYIKYFREAEKLPLPSQAEFSVPPSDNIK